jgi:hypothetical protein
VLGAVNDNILRTAVIVHAAMILPAEKAAAIGLMAAGIFTLPFVLFSAFAGTFADRHEKAGIVRLVKILEVAIALLAGLAFESPSPRIGKSQTSQLRCWAVSGGCPSAGGTPPCWLSPHGR